MQQFTNVTIEVKGKSVVITITDFTKEYGLSGTGKSIIVASTHGNVQVEGAGELVVGLNAYRKAK